MVGGDADRTRRTRGDDPPRVRHQSTWKIPGGVGLFNDSSSPARVRWMLLAFSLLAAIAVLVALLKLGRRLLDTSIALALILGLAGESSDRSPWVCDRFSGSNIIHYHWPDFKVPISAIVIGGILLFFDALFVEKKGRRRINWPFVTITDR